MLVRPSLNKYNFKIVDPSTTVAKAKVTTRSSTGGTIIVFEYQNKAQDRGSSHIQLYIGGSPVSIE